MSDPRLIFRDDATGEGVLVDDAGVETRVHLPSVPGIRYIDETRPATPPPAPLGGADGILDDHSQRIVYPPQPPGRQVPPSAPGRVPLSADRTIIAQPRAAPLTPEQIAEARAASGWTPEAAPVTPPPVARREAPLTPDQQLDQREAILGAQEPGPVLAMPQAPLTPEQIDIQREALLSGLEPGPMLTMPGAPTGAMPVEDFAARLDSTSTGPVIDVPALGGTPSTPRALATARPHTGTRPARGAPSTPAIRTPVLSPQTVRDLSQPEAFDETIAGITGQEQATRGSPGNPFDLVDRQTQIAQREAQLAGDDARRQQQIAAASEDERRAIETERQGAMRQATDRYQRAVDRVANARIDPNGWFRDQGAFGTVGATIAVALGALGGAISGTSTNAALDGINAAIDRDIAAQQSEIESGQAAAGMEANMLAITGEEFEDREAARLAARSAMLDQAALELQAHTADLASDEALVNAEALRGQIAAQAEEARIAAIDLQSQIDLRNAQARRAAGQAAVDERRAARVGTGAARPHATATQASTYRELVALYPNAPPEVLAQLAGLPVEDLGAPTTTSTAEDSRALAPISGALDELDRLTADPEADIPGVGPLDGRMPGMLISEEGGHVRRTIGRALETFGRLESQGAISPDELDSFGALLLGAGTDDDLREGVSTIRAILGDRIGGRPSGTAAHERDLDGAGAWDTP